MLNHNCLERHNCKERKRGKEKVNIHWWGLPDELGLHWVVEWHEHFCVFADLTHHVLQSHKESERWRGGKLCLPGQINILLLRLSEGSRGIAFSIGLFFHSFRSHTYIHTQVDLGPVQFEQWAQEKVQRVKREILYIDAVSNSTPDSWISAVSSMSY